MYAGSVARQDGRFAGIFAVLRAFTAEPPALLRWEVRGRYGGNRRRRCCNGRGGRGPCAFRRPERERGKVAPLAGSASGGAVSEQKGFGLASCHLWLERGRQGFEEISAGSSTSARSLFA